MLLANFQKKPPADPGQQQTANKQDTLNADQVTGDYGKENAQPSGHRHTPKNSFFAQFWRKPRRCHADDKCVVTRQDDIGKDYLKNVKNILHYDAASSNIMSETFSPIIIAGALVLPEVITGMIDASATRKPRRPCTRRR